MQFLGRALLASAVVLAACAGGDSATDTAAAVDTAAAPAAGAATAEAPAPVTGTTHEVQMVLQNGQYLYVPANITVKPGDAIKFINVSGGPHNVQFKEADIADDMESVLAANMPQSAGSAMKLGPLNGPLLTEPNASYTISFANVKPGQYPYVCTPHEALGMKGVVTVQ